MFTRISISLSFTKSQWFSFSTKKNKQRRGRPSAVMSLRSKMTLQRGSRRHTGCLAGSSLYTQGSPDKSGRKMVPREGLYNLSFTFQQFCLPTRGSSPAEAEVWVWDAADGPTGVVTSGSKVRPMTTPPWGPNPAGQCLNTTILPNSLISAEIAFPWKTTFPEMREKQVLPSYVLLC